MLKIGIITGSTRPNRKSLDVAKWVLDEKSVGTMLDQVVAWGGALKQLR